MRFEPPSQAAPKHLSELIGQIYDCTLDPGLWEPTLHAIKDVLQCEYAFLRMDDIASCNSIITKNAGIDPYWLERLPALTPEIDEIIVRTLASGHSFDDPLVASTNLTRAQIDATQFAQEWGQPQGIFDYMGILLMQSPTRLALLELGRHKRRGVFSSGEAHLAALLAPHLRRAVTISNALEAVTIEKARLADTLDALTLGVVLTDDTRHILHANRSAETMMREGSTVRDGGGRLNAVSEVAADEIRHAIEIAARDESQMGKTGIAVRLSEESGKPIIAHVLPLARGSVRTTLDPSAVAAVFINHSEEDSGKVGAVASAFALTPAETRVLTKVLSGNNVAEAAHDLGIAASTVRSHLEQIFSKTGVSRQTDLVRLVARIAPATL